MKRLPQRRNPCMAARGDDCFCARVDGPRPAGTGAAWHSSTLQRRTCMARCSCDGNCHPGRSAPPGRAAATGQRGPWDRVRMRRTINMLVKLQIEGVGGC